MAESIVSIYVDKLSNLIIEEASIFGEVEGQIKLLRNELQWMRLFLKEADSKRIYDERVKLWVNQVRDVTFEAEDVIDEFINDIDHQRLAKLKFLKCLPSCISFADKLPFIHELDGRVKDINVMIERIMANKSKYGLESTLTASTSSTGPVPKEKRPPIVEEKDVVGIIDGLDNVKKMLIGGAVQAREVVSIVGMGGLGKTTLARRVYNHRDVKQHFDCFAWVYVSQEFTTKELLFNIISIVMSVVGEEKQGKKEMKKSKSKLGQRQEEMEESETKPGQKLKEMEESQLGEKLQEYLKDKKYLIVMDDVWSSQVWDGLHSHFPDSNNGSRVLITTRNKEIATHAKSKLHQLRRMSQDECWQLFLKKTFGHENTSDNLTPELEKLGRNIVAKCQGLPLAIVVLGGLLSTKEKTESSWNKVAESIDWHLNQGPESCVGILALSYNDLPYYLKSCFLYCGIFPEDSEIEVSKLIRLWMAEGFIQKRGKEILEDIAEDYLHELINRSMLEVARRKVDGRVKSCRLHDLLRDLAVSEAKDARLFELYDNMDPFFPANIRRLGVHQVTHLSPHLQSSRLRTLIFFPEDFQRKTWRLLKEHIKLIVVLDIRVKRCPKEIGQLIHLKFLRLREFGGEGYLGFLDRLVNLQTLDLEYNWHRLPCTIWKLQQLRHLRCFYCKISSQSELSRCINGDFGGIERLTNLQTLIMKARYLLMGDGLGKLVQLRKLKTWYLSCYEEQKFFDCVARLTALRSLDIHWPGDRETLVPALTSFSGHTCLNEMTFSGKLTGLSVQIQLYPPNLLKLSLRCSELEIDPMSTPLHKLPKLKSLELMYDSYKGKKMICPSQGFLALEVLTLYDLPELEELAVEEGGMPKLKSLRIDACQKMKKLSGALSWMENLETLDLHLVSDKLKEDVKNMEKENWDKIHFAVSIT